MWPIYHIYQWIQCVEGEGDLWMGSKPFGMKGGMKMLLLKGTPHEYYALSFFLNRLRRYQVKPLLTQIVGMQSSCALFLFRPELLLAIIQQVLDTQNSDSHLT
ncbi:AraC family ligand binding domain-containing protein [Paenibacillus sp. WC2504]|uniref:AraC family ligand binding domain-containing protein n=1 Tax=Paenibacillus sp. WC2504 TaxID=3461403 RepID=UPI0040462E75